MARASDTVGTIVTIVVVVVAGYLGIVFLQKTINGSKSLATTGRSASGSGLSGASGSLAEMLKGFFGGKINDAAGLQSALAASDQAIADSISNDFIPQIPLDNFDLSGVSFPINFGSPYLDTTPSDYSGDIPYVGGVDANTDPFFVTSDFGS